MKVLQYLLQHFSIIAKSIIKYESIANKIAILSKYCNTFKIVQKVLQNFKSIVKRNLKIQSIAKSIVSLCVAELF